MGFFSKHDAPEPAPAAPAPALEPLTHERVTATLDAHGYRYAIDSDGDIGGIWDDHVFYFVRIGAEREFLQVRGRWTRPLAASRYLEVLELANAWNTDKVFPKTYVRVEDDLLGVYAEHAVDYRPGVADSQLDQHLGCAVSTALAFFSHLDEQFPEAVEAFRAQRSAAARAAEDAAAPGAASTDPGGTDHV
ncbi:MAG: YbjN domain-containing protein [Cellulomonas sp.]|uniref:YbjN domain-containing protein n=1 Tax=unclassified Cellulomonas TaxID=2620175 RepID=UPI0006526FDB|nr:MULTISPECIES: YbjN domain-containing protein [unclassified Cellulomonas]KMM45772.1 hypothetical protein CWIS_08930 [Cellulomonas sp. A375-1]MCR6647102.1 YbjN domain-containing protein [Cellulomonas sp.]MCR6706046.1 YbjN domain-containing protein [Cellulomonas sp.]